MEYYFSFSILCIVVALFIKDARDDRNLLAIKDRLYELERKSNPIIKGSDIVKSLNRTLK